MQTLGTHAHGSVKNKFYWIERTGSVGNPVTYLNVAMLDAGKAYNTPTVADELQLQMDAVSILGSVYTVTYDHTLGAIKFSIAPTADLDSCYASVTDDLLNNPDFQAMLVPRTGTSQVS